jgi:hypothetical protein
MCWVLLHQVDNKIYCFDEIVIENTTTYQAIHEFIKRYPSHKGNIIINGDASGDSRHTDAERTNYVIMRNELSKVGYKSVVVKTKLGNPPIKNRIAAFNAMVQNSEGQQRLYISPNCKHLINNMKRLRYKKGTSDIDKPSTTQIKNDNKAKFLGHIFDAISYHVDYYFSIKLDRENKAS